MDWSNQLAYISYPLDPDPDRHKLDLHVLGSKAIALNRTPPGVYWRHKYVFPLNMFVNRCMRRTSIKVGRYKHVQRYAGLIATLPMVCGCVWIAEEIA